MASQHAKRGTTQQSRRTKCRRSALSAMSEMQAQAYLIARDVVRRIRLSGGPVPAPLDRLEEPAARVPSPR